MVMSFCMYAASASGPDLGFTGQTFGICHQISKYFVYSSRDFQMPENI